VLIKLSTWPGVTQKYSGTFPGINAEALLAVTAKCRISPHRGGGDGAIIFADLIGKLDVLYVHCPKCSRAGRYRVQHLIEKHGRNAKLIDWLDEITADCPKKRAHNMKDPRPILQGFDL
jgi:hypothetical protein